MPTWKRKDEQGTVHFQFLCHSCNQKKSALLAKDKWILVREGEPASCNDCTLQCALTSRELWGGEDKVRYRICEQCPSLDQCELQGRYYC